MPGMFELLRCVGNENIEFQKLNSCITSAKEKKKYKCTELSFLTQAITPNDIVLGTAKVGIVVWVDQPVIEKAYEEASKPASETAVLLEDLLKQNRQLRNIIDVMRKGSEYHEGINTGCWVQNQLRELDKK